MMLRVHVYVVALLLAPLVGASWGDDLTGADRLLCAAVQADRCTEHAECQGQLPRDLNIPDFIEVDLGARRLSTTAASGHDRQTTIEHLSREDGTIVLQGFEMGRAFSFVITEKTGQLTVAVATGRGAVFVFGACTPLSGAAEKTPKGKEKTP